METIKMETIINKAMNTNNGEEAKAEEAKAEEAKAEEAKAEEANSVIEEVITNIIEDANIMDKLNNLNNEFDEGLLGFCHKVFNISCYFNHGWTYYVCPFNLFKHKISTSSNAVQCYPFNVMLNIYEKWELKQQIWQEFIPYFMALVIEKGGKEELKNMIYEGAEEAHELIIPFPIYEDAYGNMRADSVSGTGRFKIEHIVSKDAYDAYANAITHITINRPFYSGITNGMGNYTAEEINRKACYCDLTSTSLPVIDCYIEGGDVHVKCISSLMMFKHADAITACLGALPNISNKLWEKLEPYITVADRMSEELTEIKILVDNAEKSA